MLFPIAVNRRARLRACASQVLVLASLTTAAFAHELQVGRTASNQIVMNILGGQPFDLEESPFPGFDGFAASDPGFVAIVEDDPNTGTLVLPTSSFLKFTLVGIDAGIQIWNDSGSAPMNVGETYTLGQPLFHVHPIWHSPAGIPGNLYDIQIQLFDQTGVLSASPVYTFVFTPVPEPGSLSLLLAPALVILRRR